MIYKETIFSLSYNHPPFTQYLSHHFDQKLIDIPYKKIKSPFISPTHLHLHFYKPQSLDKFSHSLKRKPFQPLLYLPLNYTKMYKSREATYLLKHKYVDYYQFIMKQKKVQTILPLKKSFELFLDYSKLCENTNICNYKLENKNDLKFDMIKNESKSDKFKRMKNVTIYVNLCYCNQMIDDIYILRKYFQIEEYWDEDDVFYKVNGYLVGKGKHCNVKIRKIENHLKLECIKEMMNKAGI